MVSSTGELPANATAPGTPQRSSGIADFLGTLFLLLDDYNIRYCVLHSWEELPERLSSDLDLAVHPEDAEKMPLVVRTLDLHGYLPIHMVRYAVKGYRYDFAWLGSSRINFAGIDVTYEYRKGGLILIPGSFLVAQRQKHGDFWVASPAAEFSYLVAKKAYRGTVSASQQQRLSVLVQELGTSQARNIARRFFGKSCSARLIDACTQGKLPDLLKDLKSRLWWKIVTRDPLNPVRDLVANCWRLACRLFQPSGLFVAILGPDGVGKSTVIGQLTKAMAPGFRGHRLFHWRPMMIHPTKCEGPVTDPHAKSPRGRVTSGVVTSVLMVDYWLGYLLVIWPLLVRTKLVVFDRYFHDLLVDPVRYRYGGPRWFSELLSQSVRPRDSLFIILDADEKVILSRKCEIPVTELQRQRRAYQQLATSLNVQPIRTDAGIEQTVEGVVRRVFEHLGHRFQHRHARWLALGDMRNHDSRSTAGV